MVLSAHLVDLVEWILTVYSRGRYSTHFVTHSPWLTTGLVVSLWAVLAFWARASSPWPYLCIAVGVFSHLLLDYPPERILLVNLYGRENREALPGLRESIVAEIWLFGLFLVIVMLLQAIRDSKCPPKGRTLACALGAVCIIAATTRAAIFWAPAYLVATLHAGILLRRELNVRLLWNLVPAIPVVALLLVELWFNAVYRRAIQLQQGGDYASAARLHHQALAIPTRSSKVGVYIYLGSCELAMKHWDTCENDLRTAVRLSEEPAWAQFNLAHFYLSDQVRGTRFYRPEEGQGILEAIVVGDYSPEDKAYAIRYLEQYRKSGILK
jgi:hypothetical protein